MRKVKNILWMILVIFILIQFFPVKKNQSTEPLTNDITTIYPMAEQVSIVLQKACYDCHSNNTRYPWYNKIQPVRWYLDNHVQEGKKHLNFNEFTTYTLKKQDDKLKEFIKEIRRGDMPLSSYTLIHTDARMSQEDTALLIKWATDTRELVDQKLVLK